MNSFWKSIPVIKYESRLRVFLNIFSVLVVLSSSAVFSYRLTFDEDHLDAVYWIFMSLFILDVGVNFFKSVKVKLDTIDDHAGIAKHYLKNWFLVDLLAAIPFTFFLEELSHAVTVRSPVLLGFFTVLRLVRLIKLLKVNSLFKDLQDSFSVNPGVMRLINFFFWFALVVDFIALGWCLIGASEQERSSGDQFIRAIYWTTTTIATIGYGDYYPHHDKNLELLYTICVQIVGVGMYGYIIGNVSSLIANIDVSKTEYLKKLEGINNYMRAKRIPASIQQKVKNYYAYLWDTRKNVSTWAMFEDIPHTLKMEMSLFLNKGIIEKVSLFKNANDIFIREVVQILEPLVFLPNDFIIRQGEYGDCMYFLSNGDVDVLVGEQKVAQLGAGSPFGETALIQDEKRNASIKAQTYCDVYKLSKSNFDGLRSKYPEFDAQVKKVVQERLKDTQKKIGGKKIAKK